MHLEPPSRRFEAKASELGSGLAEPVGRFVRAVGDGFTANTARAVTSDLGIYAAWCAARETRALPATTETVAAFVDAMAETRAPATVRRYVVSIGIAERTLGLAGTISSPSVRLALNRLHRRKGRRQPFVGSGVCDKSIGPFLRGYFMRGGRAVMYFAIS